jgi:hypothetical protein
MSEKPHCFGGCGGWKILTAWELFFRKIKKFNEISRSSNVEILEINFSHKGSYSQAVQSMQKALKMLRTSNGCTIEAGRCIQ